MLQAIRLGLKDMKQATKKELHRHSKKHSRELGHWEGRYWCDYLTRGYRRWLGKKLHGPKEIEEKTLQQPESTTQSRQG